TCLISPMPGGVADDAPMTEATIARTTDETTMCVRRGTVPSFACSRNVLPIPHGFLQSEHLFVADSHPGWAARYGASVMPWRFRRSLRIAGPLRLNFSKSGLGLSLGVPGVAHRQGPARLIRP